MDKKKMYAKQVAISLLFFCLGILVALCMFAKFEENEASSKVNTTEPTYVDFSSEPSESKDTEVCSFVAQLDNAYSSAIDGAMSNIELCEVNMEYAELWLQKTEEYYDYLCSACPEDMQDQILQEKEEWLQYTQVRIGLELNYLEQIYGSGTIVPVILSQFTYTMYREKAIELIDTHSQIQAVNPAHPTG